MTKAKEGEQQKMIKPLQQFNQEFFDEYASKDKATKPAASQETTFSIPVKPIRTKKEIRQEAREEAKEKAKLEPKEETKEEELNEEPTAKTKKEPKEKVKKEPKAKVKKEPKEKAKKEPKAKAKKEPKEKAKKEPEIKAKEEPSEEAKVEAKKETKRTRKSGAAPARAAKTQPVWKDLLFLITKIASIMLAFVLLFTFLFGLIRYQEPSMDPAIKDGDLVIYYRYTKVGYLPRDPIVLVVNGQRQVRRVVATAGDIVDITDGGLMINGSLQYESEITQKTERYTEGVEFPLTVPEGQVFVLGDSRTGATDSRIYGCVEIEDTLGKVMAVIRRRSI